MGALQYACLTRPDLAFAVNKLCQFLFAPTTTQWTTYKHVLRYVKDTLHQGHFITNSTSSQLQAFCDVDLIGNTDDRRSTGCFVVYMGQNLISWPAKKQPTVARSSTEAEYSFVAETIAEIIRLHSLLQQLKQPIHNCAIIWWDNIGASYLAVNPCFKA